VTLLAAATTHFVAAAQVHVTVTMPPSEAGIGRRSEAWWVSLSAIISGIVAVATLGLAIITLLLVIATKSMASATSKMANATESMAKSTREGTIHTATLARVGSRQSVLLTVSTEIESFLRCCAIVDEREVSRTYRAIRGTTWLNKAHFSKDHSSFDGDGLPMHDNSLAREVDRFLDEMEKLGILFAHSTNKSMIAEYVGDVVAKSRRSLDNVLSAERKDDKTMYENYVRMADECAEMWPETEKKA